MKRLILLSGLVTAFLIGAAFAGQDETVDSLKAVPEKGESRGKIEMKAMEIFGRSCASKGCHAGENPKMHLSLEAEDVPGDLPGLASRQNPEYKIIDTEDPMRSYLLLKITGGEGIKGKKMPIMKKPLTEEEVSSIIAWVEGFADSDEPAEETEAEETGNDK